jgi:hypothetical protein
MMRDIFVSSLSASSAVCLLASCIPCDRDGCKAVDHRVRDRDVSIEVGIAGAASYATDVVENGCAECPLGEATLWVWATADAVTTLEQATEVFTAGPPMLEIEIDERYEQALDAGEYLVCTDHDYVCAGITVGSAVVTVHTHSVFGPRPSLIVFEPGSKDPRTDRIFELDV